MQDFRSREAAPNPADFIKELLEQHEETLQLARELPQVQLSLLKQEKGRLARKLGANHPRVKTLEARLTQTAARAREVERLADLRRIRMCKVKEGRILVHGQVKDEFGRPLHAADVVLADTKCHPVEGKSVRSDAHGYFAFDLSPEEAADLAGRQARVAVLNPKGQPLFTADEPLDPERSRQLVLPSVRRAAVRGKIQVQDGDKKPRDPEHPPGGEKGSPGPKTAKGP